MPFFSSSLSFLLSFQSKPSYIPIFNVDFELVFVEPSFDILLLEPVRFEEPYITSSGKPQVLSESLSFEEFLFLSSSATLLATSSANLLAPSALAASAALARSIFGLIGYLTALGFFHALPATYQRSLYGSAVGLLGSIHIGRLLYIFSGFAQHSSLLLHVRADSF